MDSFDLKPERSKVNRKSLLWNVLTVVVLMSVCCLGYYFVTVFQNPNSSLNFFPPPSLPTLYQTITPTITIIQRPPTWTWTVTIEPIATRTQAFTWTPLPGMVTGTITETPTITTTEGTPTITTTPMPASAEITYVANTTIYPASGCDWLGVGGQVLDAEGKPLQFQTIQLGGTLANQLVSRMTLSGNAPAYGASGFEFVLGDHAIASTQTLWIQLFDSTSKPMTDKIFFDTHDGCDQNLVMIVFTKNP
jgi:hypothetical protein